MRWAILAALMASGCAAQMMSPPGARTGLIRYSTGLGGDHRLRSDAEAQMARACGGQYQIDGEGPRSEGGTAVLVSPTVAVATPQQFWYIQFSCLPADQHRPR